MHSSINLPRVTSSVGSHCMTQPYLPGFEQVTPFQIRRYTVSALPPWSTLISLHVPDLWHGERVMTAGPLMLTVGGLQLDGTCMAMVTSRPALLGCIVVIVNGAIAR